MADLDVVLTKLQDLVDSGDVVAWLELDDDVAFTCWRLDPDRYPDEYYPVWSCPRCGKLHRSPFGPCPCEHPDGCQ